MRHSRGVKRLFLMARLACQLRAVAQIRHARRKHERTIRAIHARAYDKACRSMGWDGVIYGERTHVTYDDAMSPSVN